MKGIFYCERQYLQGNAIFTCHETLMKPIDPKIVRLRKGPDIEQEINTSEWLCIFNHHVSFIEFWNIVSFKKLSFSKWKLF